MPDVIDPQPIVGQQSAELQRSEVGLFIQLGLEKGLSAEAMEKLYELWIKEKERQAAIEFNIAFAAFQNNCSAIVATARNEQYMRVTKDGTKQPSRYPNLDDIMRDVREPLTKNNLSYNWSDAVIKWNERAKRDELTISCVLSHIGGHQRSSSTTVPVIAGEGAVAAKTTDQQLVGIATTYAQRYTLRTVLAIRGCDPDTDGNSVRNLETLGPDELARIEELINERKLTDHELKRYLKWLSVEKVKDISMSDYDRAIKEIEKRKVEKADE